MLFFYKKTPLFLFKSILFTAVLIISSNVFAKDTITWQNPDFPPSYIKEGPFKGQGIGDSLYSQVFAYLDEYNHQTLIANFKRIIRNIEYKKNNCAIAILRNEERAKVVEYSVAHFLVHPVRIIIKAQSLKKFDSYKQRDGTYSLSQILRDEKLILGYSLGRSYSKELDTVLKTLVNEKNSTVTAQNSIFIGLLKMLVRNRIDYTLGYSHEMTYVSKDLGLKEEFLSLPITSANSLIPVYVGCPKNDWGRKIIKKLNPYLKLNRENKAYYGVYLQWLDPKAAQEYPSLVKEYFGKK